MQPVHEGYEMQLVTVELFMLALSLARKLTWDLQDLGPRALGKITEQMAMAHP